MTLSRKKRAWIAWARSFFKLRWRFEDYPIDYVDQGECPPDTPARLQHKRWRADIIHWWEISGQGDSKEAALQDAKQKFARRNSSGEAMYRPGVHPGDSDPQNPKIIFPENQEIDTYPELRDDFIRNVLGLDWAWVTDQSSLWDFHSEENNTAINRRIGEVYGVDVSHISSGNLLEIFKAIMSEIETFPEDTGVRAVRLARKARERHVLGLPPLPWNDHYS